MSSSDPDRYGKEVDPLMQPQQKSKFYSITGRPAAADTENGLSDCCQFCLLHFHKFHNMIGNVCQVCGRVAEPIRRDKQDSIKITSINSSTEPANMRAVSLDVDYSPLMDTDPTRSMVPRGGEVMTASSIGEAVRKLRTAEQSSTTMARAALTGQKFILKTTGKEDKNKVLFDDNNK